MSPGAARNALDCALWDLEAKRSGSPAWKAAGLDTYAELTTAYTISLDEEWIVDLPAPAETWWLEGAASYQGPVEPPR